MQTTTLSPTKRKIIKIHYNEGFKTWLHTSVHSDSQALSLYTMSCFHLLAYHRLKRYTISFTVFWCFSFWNSGERISFKHRSTSLLSISIAGNRETSKPRYKTQIAFSIAKYCCIPTLSSWQSSQSQSTLFALTKKPQSSTCLRLMSTDAKCSALCLSR